MHQNNFFKPLGICRRLLNFIFNNLISRGFKPIAKVLDMNCLRKELGSFEEKQPMFVINPHEQEIVQNQPLDETFFNASSSQSHTKEISGSSIEEIRTEQLEGNVRTSTHIEGPKKVLGFIDMKKDEKKSKKKGKIISEKLTIGLEVDEMKSKPPIRQVRPLFNIASNINEKSDAYIRSRKEAMRRNYNLENITY